MAFNVLNDNQRLAWLEHLPKTRAGVEELMAYMDDYHYDDLYLQFFGWAGDASLGLTQAEVEHAVAQACGIFVEEIIQLMLERTCSRVAQAAFRAHGYELKN